jgi:hypothetical protein
LLHGVYHMPNKAGVDEACIWGDYFYLEALMRLRRVAALLAVTTNFSAHSRQGLI